MKDVRSYREVTAQSDHFLVKAKVQIKIQKKWIKNIKLKEKVQLDILKNTERLNQHKNELKIK